MLDKNRAVPHWICKTGYYGDTDTLSLMKQLILKPHSIILVTQALPTLQILKKQPLYMQH
ncbi:hypothetical protein [Coxiella-like endosymbiont]|uniref:hypothetical protein n=1 Tax=Coxiella-like endosymbiont TaxID=1592897 RepID=UPI00272BEDCD|nr:hypothetical protein [Coxiella-like endosymbiont]